MISLRNKCTGHRPVHFFHEALAAAALLLASAPVNAAAGPAPLARAPSQSVDDFYRARADYPLWLAPAAGNAADQLLGLLSSSTLDGLYPDKYHVPQLQQALAAARAPKAKRKQIAETDHALSEAFDAYVDDLIRDPNIGTTYVDPQLRPKPPSPLAALITASAAPSLSDYVETLGWMHPIYGQLRKALVDHQSADDHQRQMLALNLERARALPAGKQRYIIVNAAQQRLYMYEGGKPIDSMVVVVGKPKWPTPMLTAYVRYAALNPYWYVPSDLAGEDVGQFVVKQGLQYLDKMGYEIVSDWTPNPTIIDPKTVDWQGVVDGKVEVMIRQKPGPQNFMGRMKFMFPNQFGVYLHDNPRRELFLKAARYFSGGCVRLEDAARLGRWLFGHDLDWQSAGPEQPVMLATPVPVYITYLTATPDGASIAYYDDVYGRDAARVVSAGTPDAPITTSAAASSGNK